MGAVCGGFGRWFWDVFKVVHYRSRRLLLLHGKVFSKEFVVAQCDSARTIHPYDVLIALLCRTSMTRPVFSHLVGCGPV